MRDYLYMLGLELINVSEIALGHNELTLDWTRSGATMISDSKLQEV